MKKDTGLAGRIAFVTGAAGGIGAAVVAALQGEGALVVATDHGTTKESRDEALWTARLDVADASAVTHFVDQVERDWGPIDYGVHVAGILATGSILETDPATWRHVFDVNTHGVFHVGQALARHMTARGRGSIVSVGSNAAGVPRHSMAAYAASKAAAHMFIRCLGLELGASGVRCNSVAPGSTLTPMQTGMWSDDNGAAQVIAGQPALYKAGIPLGKLATPQDIADAVLFLLSDQAGHITMADLYVDGGATLRA